METTEQTISIRPAVRSLLKKSPKSIVKFIIVHHIYSSMMISEDTLSSSFLRGIVISLVLLALQTHFSSTSSIRPHKQALRIELSSQLPEKAHHDDGEFFFKQAGGLQASGHVFVNREILYLFEIIFSDTVSAGVSYDNIPIPLISLLRILFSSAISTNAP